MKVKQAKNMQFCILKSYDFKTLFNKSEQKPLVDSYS